MKDIKGMGVGVRGQWLNLTAARIGIGIGALAGGFACSTESPGEEYDPATLLQQGLGSGGLGSGTGGSSGTGGAPSSQLISQDAVDTHIVENDSASYGSNDRISVRGDGGTNPAMVGLIKWVLTPPCATPTVLAARIEFRVLSTSAQTFRLYPANRAWVPTQANWGRASTGTAWDAPGAQGAQDRGPAFQDFSVGSGDRTLALNQAGVALVQSWLIDPNVNHGLVIWHETHVDGFSFASVNHPTAPKPTLVINYTCS